MDITKTKQRNHRDDPPEFIGTSKRSSNTPQYGGTRGVVGGGGGGMRRSSHDDFRAQYEDMKEQNRSLWAQLQTAQSERDQALANSRRKLEEYKKELEKVSYSQRAQAARCEQLIGQMRVLKGEKEMQEQRFIDDLKNAKMSLEESEQDRDSLRYKLSERKREVDRLKEQLSIQGPSNQDTKINKIISERDSLRSKLSELKQEKQAIQEKLKQANKLVETQKSSAQQASLEQKVSELQRQVNTLQQMVETTQKEKDELSEQNNDLRRQLERADVNYKDLDNDCQRLRQIITELRGMSPNRRSQAAPLSHGSSDDMLALKKHRNSAASRSGRSQGSTDEDFFYITSDNSEFPSSLSTDLANITRSFSGHMHQFSGGLMGSGNLTPLSVTHSGGEVGGAARRGKLGKFSSSTSNLSNETYERFPSQNSQQNNKLLIHKKLRLERSLEEIKKENTSLQAKVSDLEHEKGELSVQLDALKKSFDATRTDLVNTSGHYKIAKSQIDMLHKEKDVAMRDNAASYEQTIQLETKLRELQAEKEIAVQQNDITKKEMDRVIKESVANKKKLEAIKAQRQKDGGELSVMRHLKDKALQEAKDLRKKLDEAIKSKAHLEEEVSTIRETVHRAAIKLSPHQKQKGAAQGTGSNGGGTTTSQDLTGVVERLHYLENERKVIFKRLFGPENMPEQQNIPLGDIIHRIESLIRERDDMVVEIDALQKSSSKLTEDLIYNLKQRIEDLLMENDNFIAENKSLKREVNSLSSLRVKAEQDRDKLAFDYERLNLQCQQFKNKHARATEDHAKTLERVSELWKNKWPVNWDEMWEEKNVTVSLDSDGLAGFSVVGGRDQPQLPNPGAFIITVVNQGGPAEGLLKPGDILESINGINLSNADHRDAVRVVKDQTKRSLNIVFKRRKHVYPINVGIIQPMNSIPQLSQLSTTETAKPETMEYSLYITGKEKSDLGFRYDWRTICTVSSITASGPADQILEKGDRIIKVNNTDVTQMKPSAVKKIMKPHKNILRLIIERAPQERNIMGQLPPVLQQSASSLPSPMRTSISTSAIEERHSYRSPKHWPEDTTPVHKPTPAPAEPDYTQQSLTSHGSFSTLDRIGRDMDQIPGKDVYSSLRMGGGGASNIAHYKSNSKDSYSSRDSRDSRDSINYSQGTQESQDSASRPTKLCSVVTQVKNQERPSEEPVSSKGSSAQRPSSDGVMYGNFNERRIEYEEVLLSEQSDSQYSQSESCFSESSYDYGLSSSQSIDLTFHTISTIPMHNRLTVDTVMTTQAPSQQSEDEDGVGFMARDDASRTTFRNRNAGDALVNSNANNSETQEESQTDTSQLTESQTLSQEFTRNRRGYNMVRRKNRSKGHHQKSNSVGGGSRNFNKSSSDQNLARGSSNLAMWGRSRSNLSLGGRAPSMTSVAEEPRRATSTTDMSDYEHDPLADATYIRANFTYISRNLKELNIKAGDVFHIHDEAPPERFRSSFWVSRLNADGTDEQVGAIPNSMKAQDYLDSQGECLDIPLYEEVMAYTGTRPVVIFGALANQVVNSLLESFPKMFYICPTEHVQGVARLTEARLSRDVAEGKVIDFRRTESGFELIRTTAITDTKHKKHCLMAASPQALTTLKAVAPPISILIKAVREESICTFSPEPISQEQAKEIFDEVKQLEETHKNEFSASLLLVYMDTLMGQIEDIIKAEKRNQAWVPITRDDS